MQFYLCNLEILGTCYHSRVLLRFVFLFLIIISTTVGSISVVNAVEKTDSFDVLAVGFDKGEIEKLNSHFDSNDSTDKKLKLITTINSANPEDLYVALERINEVAAVIVSKKAWQSINDREKRLISAFSLTGAIVVVCSEPNTNSSASAGLLFFSESTLSQALFTVETKLANFINSFSNPVVLNEESIKYTPIRGAVAGLKLVEIRPNLNTATVVSTFLETEILTREFNGDNPKHRFDLVRFLLNRNLTEPLDAKLGKQNSDLELSKAAVSVRNFELRRTILALAVSIISALFVIYALHSEGMARYRIGAALISVVLLVGAIAILLPVSKQSYVISKAIVRQSETLKLAIVTGEEEELVSRRSGNERFLETKSNHYIDASEMEFPISLIAKIEASGDVVVTAKSEHESALTDVRIGFGAFSANIGRIEPNGEVGFRIPKVSPAKSNQDIIQSETQEEAVNLAIRRMIRKRFGTPLSPHSTSFVYPVGEDYLPESALLFNCIAYESPWLTATLNDKLKVVMLEHIGTVYGS